MIECSVTGTVGRPPWGVPAPFSYGLGLRPHISSILPLSGMGFAPHNPLQMRLRARLWQLAGAAKRRWSVLRQPISLLGILVQPMDDALAVFDAAGVGERVAAIARSAFTIVLSDWLGCRDESPSDRSAWSRSPSVPISKMMVRGILLRLGKAATGGGTSMTRIRCPSSGSVSCRRLARRPAPASALGQASPGRGRATAPATPRPGRANSSAWRQLRRA